jgi:hypothetical protein
MWQTHGGGMVRLLPDEVNASCAYTGFQETDVRMSFLAAISIGFFAAGRRARQGERQSTLAPDPCPNGQARSWNDLRFFSRQVRTSRWPWVRRAGCWADAGCRSAFRLRHADSQSANGRSPDRRRTGERVLRVKASPRSWPGHRNENRGGCAIRSLRTRCKEVGIERLPTEVATVLGTALERLPGSSGRWLRPRKPDNPAFTWLRARARRPSSARTTQRMVLSSSFRVAATLVLQWSC